MLAVAAPAAAQEARFAPEIPKATGKAHPEGNAHMRRFHMNMMKHDRDLTVYDGDRAVTASLGECFDCHTVQDEAGIPVTAADERHFCRVCHDFTAVQVDCFDCHRSTPDDFAEPELHALTRGVIGKAAGADQIALVRAWLTQLPGPGTEAIE